jgi:pilus assembly protein CpaE
MPNYLLNAGGDERALDDIDRRLKLAIPDLKRVASFEDIPRPSLREEARSIAIVVAQAAATDLSDLVNRISKRKKDVFFVFVGGDLSARDYKLLMQTGNADWVAEAGSTEEILNIVRREKEAKGAGASDRPVVVSFVPSGGGVGNTTLAIETAVQLAKRKIGKGAKVALIDLDFQTSHVCDYLDLAPKFRVEEIIEAPERLDDHLLDVFASRHSSGVDVFAVPRERLRIPTSASSPFPPCSSAWPITTPISWRTFRFPLIRGRSRSSRRRKGSW